MPAGKSGAKMEFKVSVDNTGKTQQIAGLETKEMILKMEMGAGHGGPSGRYEAWRDEAFVLAFVLDQLGLAET